MIQSAIADCDNDERMRMPLASSFLLCMFANSRSIEMTDNNKMQAGVSICETQIATMETLLFIINLN